ncbi:MAG: helix-turn-helix domain-containing protein [Bosea sp.]|nr:helix-turn-helix domain-containing protein [Bosea sp. (in: a-proteobacteria)]
MSELASELAIPPSSCFGLLKSMIEHGYLYSVGSKKHLYPTRLMLQHTLAIDRHEPILPRLMPRLERLRTETRETILLAQLNFSEPSVVYLAVLEGLELIRYTAAIGLVRAIEQAATGKALLSHMNDKALNTMLGKLRLKNVEDREAFIARLKTELAEGKSRGYLIHRGQNVVDVTSIAKPLSIAGRDFAIGIAGPVHRMELNFDACVDALNATCADLERPS